MRWWIETNNNDMYAASVFLNYPIRRKFVQSIVEGASRYESTKNKSKKVDVPPESPSPSSPSTDTLSNTNTSDVSTDQSAPSNHETDSALTAAYCTLCAILYVKMTQKLLR